MMLLLCWTWSGASCLKRLGTKVNKTTGSSGIRRSDDLLRDHVSSQQLIL